MCHGIRVVDDHGRTLVHTGTGGAGAQVTFDVGESFTVEVGHRIDIQLLQEPAQGKGIEPGGQCPARGLTLAHVPGNGPDESPPEASQGNQWHDGNDQGSEKLGSHSMVQYARGCGAGV